MNSKRWRKSKSSELKAMAKVKKLGTPSDGENKKARNSKRWRESKSPELQAMAEITAEFKQYDTNNNCQTIH